MRHTRIKFCGMTRRADIDAAVALGVDAVGLIIAERSPRRLTVERAARLASDLPPLLSTVLLCMNNEPAQIREAVDAVRPDFLQFHDEQPAALCESFGRRYLKAVPMGSLGDEVALAAYLDDYPGAAGFVLDSHAAGAAGGSGERFDWVNAPRPARPWLLAGGLNPDNVADAMASLRPFAVDVSSGIESAPGIKDHERMRRFVAAVRRADAHSEQDQ